MTIKVQISMLNSREFEHYWPKIEQCLDAEPELWNRTLTKEALYQHVLSGLVQMWAVCDRDTIHLVFMSQVVIAPAMRYLEVFWGYGTDLGKALVDVDGALDRFAAHAECERIDLVGRRGFERILRPLGAEYVCSTYSRPVRIMRNN